MLLPYCRHNSLFALFSITSTIISTYVLYYGDKLGYKLQALNIVLGLVILLASYVQHWPWRRFDFIWILPIFSATVSTVLRLWFDQTLVEIARLRTAQYSTKNR